jgi:hypothetical protein
MFDRLWLYANTEMLSYLGGYTQASCWLDDIIASCDWLKPIDIGMIHGVPGGGVPGYPILDHTIPCGNHLASLSQRRRVWDGHFVGGMRPVG